MTTHEPSPPRWAETVLRSLLAPADRESISGDLLEEYREARRPSLGPLRANAWYIAHVSSLWWRVVWPFAAVVIAQSVLTSITVFRPGHHAPGFQPVGPSFVLQVVGGSLYGSLLPAPGVSLFDALVYFAAGYYGFQRTRLFRTALLAAGSTSVAGFAALFLTAALVTPGLMLAPVTQPLIVFILSVYLMIPLGFAVLVGALAATLGKWITPAASRKLGVS